MKLIIDIAKSALTLLLIGLLTLHHTTKVHLVFTVCIQVSGRK